MERYKRLNKIINLVEKNQRVLDIGTDHGYVPIILYENNITTKVDGSDLRENPIKIAIKNLEKKHLENKIKIFKSNGIEGINVDNYDVFIIAGMGGKNISSILKQKKITQDLILHPTNNVYELRKTLKSLKYKIVFEEIVLENNVNNIIIKAVKTNGIILSSKSTLIIGPILKKDKSNFTHNYYVEKMNYYENLYNLSNKTIHKKYYKSFKKGIKWKEKNF